MDISFRDIDPVNFEINSFHNFGTNGERERRGKMSQVYRIIGLIEGSAVITFGGRDYDMQPGDFAYLTPGEVYDTRFKNYDIYIINIFFDFIRRQKYSNVKEYYFASNVCNSNLQQKDILDLLSFSDVKSLNRSFVQYGLSGASDSFVSMYNENVRRRLYYRVQLNAMLSGFLVKFVRGLEQPQRSGETRTVIDILTYINDNYARQLTCGEVAARFNYHPNYINRIVRNYTGMTLKQYINDSKIRVAKDMLISTDKTVSAIAADLGFGENSHFSNLFRKTVGMSPTVFRETSGSSF